MEKQSVQTLQEIIGNNEAISIAVGKNPSIDEMGAALALYLSLQNSNKKVTIACPTDPIVELSSLVGINKVKNTLGGEGGDLIVSFPYNEGEIDKVSYTLEEGFLNIIVKAGSAGLSFSEKDVRYKREGGKTEVLFVIGTPRLSNLGSLFNPQTLKNTTVINIDNKAENQGFGDVVIVSTGLSSVSEQIASLIVEINLPVDADIAQNLLSGISFATQNFQNPDTSFLAFQMAGVLMKKGAIREKASNLKMPKKDLSAFLNEDFDLDENEFPGMDDLSTPVNQPQQKINQGGFQQRQQNKSYQKPSQNVHQHQRQPQNQSQYQNVLKSLNQLANQAKNQTEKKDNIKEEKKDDNTPPDWLTPKIYKGSSSIE